ncbi:MAG: HPr family phosphocarrier protein [Peptoniphilaceae bacterium]
MKSKEITITNATGLHLRPAGQLTKVAESVSSEVTLVKDNNRINAKSMMNILSAQIKKGDKIILEVEGENEEADLQTIAEAIESGLGE